MANELSNSMNKSTIFFSHSSLDKEYISLLKSKLSNKTAKTIEIFQSSDGESIPFGNNWVHKVEESLNNAKIMLVFISPRSMTSSWIYFEAGYSYSKDIKVIPIGICGIDVGGLKPPLNLLQGFNIASSDGLNNLITVINREFNCEFHEAFTEQDYFDFSLLDGSNSAETLGVLEVVDYMYFGFPNKFQHKAGADFSIKDDALDIIGDCLNGLNIQNEYSDTNKIHVPGMIFMKSNNATASIAIKMKVDPYSFHQCDEIINLLCTELYGEKKLIKFWCNVIFNKDVSLETTDFKVSSKLHKCGMEMSELSGKFFKYEGIDFELLPKPKHDLSHELNEESLKVIFNAGGLESELIIELIKKLMEAKVIKEK